MMAKASIREAAQYAITELAAHARPPGAFDPVRYFRTTVPVTFLNTGTPFVHALGKSIAREHKAEWTVRDGLAFADLLIRDHRFEVKAVGIETLSCFTRALEPAMLSTFKRWLASNHCANWATTDSLCGSIVGPLLLAHPELVPTVQAWTAHRNLWVRRAAAVALIKPAARGVAVDAAYKVATALRPDRHDLIHKAAGWLLREAGRTDPARLQRYLRDGGPAIPRTMLRYAIERFDPATRNRLLLATRTPRPGRGTAANSTSRRRQLV